MKIINSCEAVGLPTPEMNEKEGGFIVTLFKDRFSKEELHKLGLNARQIKAVLYVKKKGKITNSEYQEINGTSERTASRDLEELYRQDIFERTGESKSTFYTIKNGGYGV